MSEAQDKEALQASNLNALKQSHDLFATAIQVLTTRVQYFHEEFEGIQKVVSFLRVLRQQTQNDIEKIEPPKPEEPKAPYEMDLSHVKNEKTPLEVVQ